MTLPPMPTRALEAAWFAVEEHVHAETLKEALDAAWPHLYAAALTDFADRMERAAEIAGKTAGPEGFDFVVSCARAQADDQT